MPSAPRAESELVATFFFWLRHTAQKKLRLLANAQDLLLQCGCLVRLRLLQSWGSVRSQSWSWIAGGVACGAATQNRN